MSKQHAVSLINFIERISENTGRVIQFMLIPLVMVIIYEVTARYAFNAPTLWAWDICRQFTGAVIILAGGYTLLYDAHIRVDIIIQRFSEKTKARIEVIAFAFLVFVCAIMMWQGTDTAIYSFGIRERMETTFAPPIYPLKMLIPLGYFLILLQGIARFMRSILFILAPGTIETGFRSH